MRDETVKFLLINAEEISKQVCIEKRSHFLFITKISYSKGEKRTAKEIFDRYNVKEEFQKVIIGINPYTKEAAEYTTGFPFYITENRTIKANQEKSIGGTNSPVEYNKQSFKDKISFSTQPVYLSYEDVMVFLGKIKDSGESKLYTYAISDFFDISLNHTFQNQTRPRVRKRTLQHSRINSKKR